MKPQRKETSRLPVDSSQLLLVPIHRTTLGVRQVGSCRLLRRCGVKLPEQPPLAFRLDVSELCRLPSFALQVAPTESTLSN